MSDIMSILQAGYTSAATITPSKGTYTAVDPATYQGTWTGTYSNNQKFQLTVSQVHGFRAEVKYHDASGVSNQSVLIKGGTFRFGNSKFSLTADPTPAKAATAFLPATAAKGATANVYTAVTNAQTGKTSLVSGQATQEID
jgi:hypothetical protein